MKNKSNPKTKIKNKIKNLKKNKINKINIQINNEIIEDNEISNLLEYYDNGLFNFFEDEDLDNIIEEIKVKDEKFNLFNKNINEEEAKIKKGDYLAKLNNLFLMQKNINIRTNNYDYIRKIY